MSEIKVRHDFTVDLIDVAGSDHMICKAARVSTLNDDDGEMSFGDAYAKDRHLLNYLMKNRHGSPFEHGLMTFRIEAPIFVWREFMRHRIGVSYNEQSGRYSEMKPEFYVPGPERNLVQVGRPGAYSFAPGSVEQFEETTREMHYVCNMAWDAYQGLLNVGVAREVARMCLPLSIYSAAYVTMNPRSLMHFLSLRVFDDRSIFRSFPMWEIEQVARKIETEFAAIFPTTHAVFVDKGRVCP